MATIGAPARRLTVSVIIPVKDEEAELERCLRALALQSQSPDEIIVVDNGSSDGSAELARRSGARVIRCDRPGIPAASAAGYDAAHNDLLLRLDADSLPPRTWVAAMATAFRERPSVDVFTGSARFIDGPRVMRTPLVFAYLASYVACTAPALGHLPLFGSNLGFRRAAWLSVRDRVHRADSEIHDDLDLAFHLGERHRIRFLARPSVGVSMRPFASKGSFVRRLNRGVRTVLIHWPEDFPPVRWTRLALRRVRHLLGVTGG